MTSKKQNLKIATILPYKENYSLEYASAASLWVAEFFEKSRFKQKNFISKIRHFHLNINLKKIEMRGQK